MADGVRTGVPRKLGDPMLAVPRRLIGVDAIFSFRISDSESCPECVSTVILLNVVLSLFLIIQHLFDSVESNIRAGTSFR